MSGLHKTVIVIWSEFDASEVELEDLAREATSGEAYCAKSETRFVADHEADPDWDETEFFGVSA